MDLPTKGILSAIEVEIRATNGGTSNANNPVSSNVKKIEVVDGSEKFHSLYGPMERFLSLLGGSAMEDEFISESASAVEWARFYILFGRYLGDPQYFLDLSRMSNPRLEVDWNEAEVNTAGATGFVSDSGVISIRYLIDQLGPFPSQMGYLRAIEKDKWTSASSGDHITELDTKYPLRTLITRAKLAQYRCDQVLTDVKLSLDSDKFIPFNDKVAHVVRQNAQQFKLKQMASVVHKAADAGNLYLPVQDVMQVAITPKMAVTSLIAGLTSKAADWVGLVLRGHDGATYATATDLETIFAGLAPYACFAHRWDFPGYPDQFLPLPNYGEAKLYLTMNTANAACRVAVEEVATQ
jgi:hypothetical protein